MPLQTDRPGPEPITQAPVDARAALHSIHKAKLGAAGTWAVGAARDACAQAFGDCFEFPEFKPGDPPTPEQVAEQERLLHRLRDTLALVAVALDGLDPAGAIGVEARA